MADEQIVKLLEEIRDLQKLHVSNQQQALEVQKSVVRRGKIGMIVFVVFILAMIWLSYFPHGR